MTNQANTTNAAGAMQSAQKKNTYRICDEVTSDEISAKDLNSAVARYLANYDTAEMEQGETFPARVYAGDDLMDLCAVVTVTADGKKGVEDWDISPR